MRIFLTGAAGFTGVHFSAQARLAGHEVIPSGADLRDRPALTVEIEAAQPDAVVHLAAISFVQHADAGEMYDVNLFGTLNLLEAILATPHRPRVLLASSANVYGNAPVSPIGENQQPAPVNHYAMSKLAMEFMARNHQDALDLFFTRPFNYTGPGQAPSFVVPKLVRHFAERLPRIELGNIDVEREFNDVRFVADCYLRLLGRARRGQTFNICTGITYSLSGLIEKLALLTGHRPEIHVNPAFVRANEVQRLCGDPSLLKATIGQPDAPSLDATLRWMLQSHASAA